MSTYLKLCIANLKLTFGDDFLLLSTTDVVEMGIEMPNKQWHFGGNRTDPNVVAYREVVAKSDYIRMAVNTQIDGFWLDTDTVVFEDFRASLIEIQNEPGSLLWYTESFFGARKGNAILAEAAKNMIDMDQQIWANPGEIHQIIENNHSAVEKLPYSLIGPGYEPIYRASSAGVVFEDIEPEHFLLNPHQKVLKLYNSELSGMDRSKNVSVREFLHAPMLLSRIMLQIEPNVEAWEDAVRWVERHVARAS